MTTRKESSAGSTSATMVRDGLGTDLAALDAALQQRQQRRPARRLEPLVDRLRQIRVGGRLALDRAHRVAGRAVQDGSDRVGDPPQRVGGGDDRSIAMSMPHCCGVGRCAHSASRMSSFLLGQRR